MVSYSITSKKSGDCEVIARKIRDDLVDLWQKQIKTGKEWAMGFKYNGENVVVGDKKEGFETSMPFITEQETMDPIMAAGDTEYKYGTVHTHPKAEDMLSMAMSANDINTHLRTLDIFKRDIYNYSYILTRLSEDELVMIGIETERTPSDLAGIQREVADIQDVVDEKIRNGEWGYDTYSRKLNEVAEKLGGTCSAVIPYSKPDGEGK